MKVCLVNVQCTNMSGITGDYVYGSIKFRCKYPSCLNSYCRNSSSKNKRFFCFPRNPDTLLSWKKACSISPSKNCSNLHVCEDHFLPCDFNNPSKPTRLKLYSVPRPLLKYQIHHDHSYSFRTPLNISSFMKNFNDYICDPKLSYLIHHDHPYYNSRTSLNDTSVIENIRDSNKNNPCDPGHEEISDYVLASKEFTRYPNTKYH